MLVSAGAPSSAFHPSTHHGVAIGSLVAAAMVLFKVQGSRFKVQGSKFKVRAL
jgi:hypothetical protein